MEEMHMARYGETYGASMLSEYATAPDSPLASKLSNPCHFLFLCRILYIGMVAETTGCWQSIQTSDLLEVRKVALKVSTF